MSRRALLLLVGSVLLIGLAYVTAEPFERDELRIPVDRFRNGGVL